MDKISWYLEENLNSHPHLFQNIENVDYEVATFICVCGKIHIALKNKF